MCECCVSTKQCLFEALDSNWKVSKVCSWHELSECSLHCFVAICLFNHNKISLLKAANPSSSWKNMRSDPSFPFRPNHSVKRAAENDTRGEIRTWRSYHFSLLLWEVTVCISFFVQSGVHLSTVEHFQILRLQHLWVIIRLSEQKDAVCFKAARFSDWHPHSLHDFETNLYDGKSFFLFCFVLFAECYHRLMV